MFIFSKDGETIANSDNVKCFNIEHSTSNYYIMADEYYIEAYSIKDDAVKELNEIIRQIESGATRYDLS